MVDGWDLFGGKRQLYTKLEKAQVFLGRILESRKTHALNATDP